MASNIWIIISAENLHHSVPLLQFVLLLLAEAIRHLPCIDEFPIGLLKADESLLLQQTVVYPYVLVLYLLDLLLPERNIQRPLPVHRLQILLFLLVYPRNLLEQEPVFAFYFCELGLKDVLFFVVFLEDVLVRRHIEICGGAFALLKFELKESSPVIVHPMCDLLLLNRVLENCRQSFNAHRVKIIIIIRHKH